LNRKKSAKIYETKEKRKLWQSAVVSCGGIRRKMPKCIGIAWRFVGFIRLSGIDNTGINNKPCIRKDVF
jgi:hypothetical protein